MISYTDEEIEEIRLAAIATCGIQQESEGNDADWLKDLENSSVTPISLHEALHTAWIYLDSVEKHLMSHTAILMDKEAFKLAHEAHTALFNLYQKMGSKSTKTE